MLLQGKVAIVTESTDGLGLEIVKAMLEAGASVALCGTDKDDVLEARLKINQENSNWDLTAITADLNKIDQVQLAFDGIEEMYGHIDILVNNAGISNSTLYSQYTLGQFQLALESYISRTLNSSRAVSRYMSQAHKGAIINVGAMPGIEEEENKIIYPTLRSTVKGLTRSMAHNLASEGIRVNAVSPGIINTKVVEALPEEVRKNLVEQIPLGHIGTIQDVTNAINFLASDQASYISGTMLLVDGLVLS